VFLTKSLTDHFNGHFPGKNTGYKNTIQKLYRTVTVFIVFWLNAATAELSNSLNVTVNCWLISKSQKNNKNR